MAERNAITFAVTALTFAASLSSAQARVQDYQIVRLVTYTTDCQISALEPRPSAKSSLQFFATCENITFYPNGIEILCDDPDDDRSCHLLTQPQSFDQLHLLDQRK